MKSMQELEAIRERARKAMQVRQNQEGGPVISVAMGTCGIAKGARDVMMALVDEAAKRGLDSVVVTQSGCAGYCEHEPMIKVQLPHQDAVYYGSLDERKARDVVARHLVQGEIANDYVLQLPGGEPLA